MAVILRMAAIGRDRVIKGVQRGRKLYESSSFQLADGLHGLSGVKPSNDRVRRADKPGLMPSEEKQTTHDTMRYRLS